MKNKKGFTLIEAILTLSLLAAGVIGVLTIYQRNITGASEMEQTLVATSLAQEKLEQIIHDKKYLGYAYIVQTNYLPSEYLMDIGYLGYTRTVTIREVSPSDLTSPPQGNEAGYTRVTVSVYATQGSTVTFETLVTDWEQEF